MCEIICSVVHFKFNANFRLWASIFAKKVNLFIIKDGSLYLNVFHLKFWRTEKLTINRGSKKKLLALTTHKILKNLWFQKGFRFFDNSESKVYCLACRVKIKSQFKFESLCSTKWISLLSLISHINYFKYAMWITWRKVVPRLLSAKSFQTSPKAFTCSWKSFFIKSSDLTAVWRSKIIRTMNVAGTIVN